MLGAWDTLLALSTKRGRGGVLKLRNGTRKRTSLQLLTRICIQLTNKLVNSFPRAPLVLGQATSDSGLTRLITARTRGKPPPSPIQYSLRLSVAPTSEWLFIPRPLRGGFEIVSVWTPATLRGYNSLFRPLIRMRFDFRFSLCHNLCYKCPNGSCEPIFDIYVSITFQ